ncbi:MAG: CPBP family intramembrane metalloprotease [Muribaculum sp.]|nr:CPBP family intramembrane metalloprotease [Muribaculum sp.]
MTTISHNKYIQPGIGDVRLKPGASLGLLLCWWILSWILGSLIISGVVPNVRLAVLVQNIVMFIFPAFMSALLISSRPFRYLRVAQMPGMRLTLLTIIVVIAAIPFLNYIVARNESVHLPESLSSLEASMRALEDMAQQMVLSIMGEPTVSGLIVSVLLIGVLTGIGEEVFFRGGLQSILVRMFGNTHVAIWVTAAVFSAVHFEFFGFVPRLLLGAFLGYLVVWSGSLWLSILAHALNNSIVVVCMWAELRTGNAVTVSKLGEGTSVSDILFVVLSAVAVAFLLKTMYQCRDVQEQGNAAFQKF